MPSSVTQSEIGRTYLHQHKDTRYFRGHFHRYDHGVWEPLHEAMVNREVWTLLESQESVGACRPTANLRNGVIHYVEDHTFVAADEIDAQPHLINLENGSYDLDQQILQPHNQDDYLTTQLLFAYNPAAKCPTWQYYLESSLTLSQPMDKTHDSDLALFLQEAVGYSLTNDVSYHISFWCYGKGANGKGILFHVLESLGGTSAVPFNVNLLRRDRYQLADLAGKRIALCSEANSSDNVIEDGDIKALIAGDQMNVRQIRERTFQMRPQVKLWWSMNKLPTVTDTSTGFWRRIAVIPFNRSFEPHERQRDLKERLLDELPGIFNWAMIGLQRLYVNGQFTEPRQVKDQTEEYQKESNTVGLFVDEECQVINIATVQSSMVYKRYSDWCKANGYRAFSSRSFKREMELLGFYTKRVTAGIIYQGIDIVV